MPQKMNASEARMTMASAGAPPELMDAAEAKGVDLNSLWDAYLKIKALWEDASQSTAQKAWATLLILVSLLPAAGSAPV